MNCENNIKRIIEVQNSDEFFYQKLQDTFEKFKSYQISQNDTNELIKNLEFKPFSFDEYLTNNDKFNELILLMGQIIAMSDLNGYNKEQWNLYDDKRVVAKAGVRQNDWVRNLLKFKTDNNSNSNLTDSVKNALEFIENPTNNITQLSINHKKLVSINLLNTSYDKDKYFEQLKIYFKDELKKYPLNNEKNFGLLISLFLYCDEIRTIWDDNTDYWLVGSIWDNIDKTEEFVADGVWLNGFDDKYLTRVKSVKIGDKIAIKSSYTKSKNLPFDNRDKSVSTMKIKAIGEVTANPKDGTTLEVSWDNDFIAKEIYGFTYRNTISKIDKEKWQEPIKWIFENKEQDDFDTSDNTEIKDKKKMPKNTQTHPLNQILYGPPGTGKTYRTINKALGIIENRVVGDDEDRVELKESFDKYRKDGQIEFITFHQSYGYEEFVEGIKADLKGDEVKYKLEKGIFQKLSKTASRNIEQSKENTIIKKDFEMMFKEKILDKLLKDEKLEIKMKKSSFYIKEVDETHIMFDKSGGDSQHVLLMKNLKAMYESEENKIIIGGLSQYYNPLLAYLLENNEIKNEEKEPLKNYILIIDEINRGNISKIFGELITLIEPSKRIGADEEIILKLPNSSDSFGVPSNLYIIGTMNTADRSIAQIDTALRRRFEFVEMMPKPELLVDEANEPLIIEEIEVQEILKAINERIEYIYDREHTIGHSYFMPLIEIATKEKLEEIFRVNIIPLLAEYFYGNWADIKIILNDKDNSFITEQDKPTYIMDDSKKNNKIYKVNKIFKESGYKNIYETKTKEETQENK